MRQGSCGFGETQSGSLFTIRCYRDHSVAKLEPSNQLDGWLLCYDMLASHPEPPVTIQTARSPISTGNIGKWLSEIIFGWKHYSDYTKEAVVYFILSLLHVKHNLLKIHYIIKTQSTDKINSFIKKYNIKFEYAKPILQKMYYYEAICYFF